MSLAPLPPRESAVDGCARAVQAAILRGELAPGERLPPERLLSQQLGVSRLTLRAGLAKVAATGLLSVRQGSGYLVQDYRQYGGAELLPGLAALAGRASRAAMLRDLLLVRRQLARAVLERLVEHKDGDQLIRIGAAIEAFAALVAAEAPPAAIAAADVGVVAALLEATGSQVLQLCLNPVVAVLRDLPELRDAMYGEPRRNLEGYRMLLAWLLTRSASSIDVIIQALEQLDEHTLARLGEPRARPRRPR